MYIAAISTAFIVLGFVLLGLYLAGKQDSVEKKLSSLIVHIDSYSDEATRHLKETISHARESLDRFDKLQNLSDDEFIKEEKVIKDLIKELSIVKTNLAKA